VFEVSGLLEEEDNLENWKHNLLRRLLTCKGICMKELFCRMARITYSSAFFDGGVKRNHVAKVIMT
jgi:hypothetical protein